MVRLKLIKVVANVGVLTTFQFHYGSIKIYELLNEQVSYM